MIMGKNYPDLAVPSIHSGWWLNYFFQSFFYLPPPLVIAGPINCPYPITAQVKVTFINTSWLMFWMHQGYSRNAKLLQLSFL